MTMYLMRHYNKTFTFNYILIQRIPQNLDEQWSFFKISLLVNKISSLKESKTILKKSYIWFDEELKNLAKEKEKLHTLAKLSKIQMTGNI